MRGPNFTTVLVMITTKGVVRVAGGAELLPGRVNHSPEHAPFVIVTVPLSAYPLKLAGAGPPLRLLLLAHWAPQNWIQVVRGAALWSPTTKNELRLAGLPAVESARGEVAAGPTNSKSSPPVASNAMTLAIERFIAPLSDRAPFLMVENARLADASRAPRHASTFGIGALRPNLK
jgi:hypothetical protein